MADKKYNVMTREQARDFDNWAINTIGMPGVVLMENGYVIARHLINCGYEVCTVIIGDSGKIKGDAKINLDVLFSMNQKIDCIKPEDKNIENQVLEFAAEADMVIDGIFGT